MPIPVDGGLGPRTGERMRFTTHASTRGTRRSGLDERGLDERGLDERGLDEHGLDERGSDERGSDERSDERSALERARAHVERPIGDGDLRLCRAATSRR
jgi:hypothetical protein